MRVGDIMTKDVVTVDTNASTREVARLMSERNVGAVVVIENRKLKGIVTDRQIVVHAVGKGLDVDETRVREIMHDNPVVCNEKNTIWEAAQTCYQKGPFRRLPVVNDDKEVVGILSIADLALVAHPLLEAVLKETEASVDEAKVDKFAVKHEIQQRIPREVRH